MFSLSAGCGKIAKAFLVLRESEYPLTHNLFVILEEILKYDSSADYLRESLAVLSPYSVEVRYPGDAWLPSIEDAKEARQAAQEVLDWMQSKMERLF